MKKIKQSSDVFTCTLFLIITVFIFNACSKDVPDNEFNFSNMLDGPHAMPPNTGVGTGTCNATYDSISNQLVYTITWTDVTGTPTAVNFQAPVPGTQDFKNIPVNKF